MTRAEQGQSGETQIVLRDQANGIATIMMNRPPANALSLEMMDQLISAFEAIRDDENVKVVVLGSMTKVFCAGHDLKELTAARTAEDAGKAFFSETFAKCSKLMQTIVNLPQPVIAIVNGVATAAGCQLVATCDLAMASENASFATPGVNIGLFCSTPMVALSRNVGKKQAMEMLLTGEAIDSGTARDFGLVNRVVPSEYLTTIVHKYASAIASKSKLTIQTGKQAFYNQAEMNLDVAYKYTSQVMVENMMADDAQEGITAFIEKRDPKWQNK